MSLEPPNKKARQSLRMMAQQQEEVVSSSSASSLMTTLDDSVRSRILSFLVHPPKKLCPAYMSLSTIAAVKNCSLVSKAWQSLTRDLVNKLSTPCADIVTKTELADIKARMTKIDLKCVRKPFIRNMKEKWGHLTFSLYDDDDEEDEVNALDFVVENTYGSYDRFAKAVEKQYRKFLFVKCIERVAASKNRARKQNVDPGTTQPPSTNDPVMNIWLEKCCPSALIDVFWHSHILHPAKYFRDGRALIGKIIGHDPGYVMKHKFAGSDFASKKRQVFQFEIASVGDQDDGVDLDVLHSDNLNLVGLAESLWEDMLSNDFDQCG